MAEAGQRRPSSVVAGLRVVPNGNDLVIDPIESDWHHRLGHTASHIGSFALEHEGGQLAMVIDGSPVVVESVADGRQQLVGCTTDPVVKLESTDSDHRLLVGGEVVQICAWSTGEVVSELELPRVDADEFGLSEPGSGQLAPAPSTNP